MQKINFQNLPSTDTPINDTNLNLLQDNVETAINLKADQDYIDGTKPMGNIVVDSIRSKNMFNQYDLNNNLFIPTNSTTEELSSYTGTQTTKWIACKPNTTYILSGTNVNRFRVQYKNSSGTITYGGDKSDNQAPYTFTTSNDTILCRIYFYTGTASSFSDVQLEEGSTPTNFGSYQGLGYISGSNANGNYIKYDDGTLICWNRVVVSSIAINSAEGSLYKSDNITPFPDYPISFIDSPSLSMESISDDGPRWFWIVKSQGDSIQRIRGIRLFSAISQTLSNAKLSYIAIGRWK